MRVCGVDQEDVADMVKEIRALNPKPGLLFGGEPVQTLVPDVYIRRASDGGWVVELNSDTLPRVLVNSRYYAKINRDKPATPDKQMKSYLSDCLNSASSEEHTSELQSLMRISYAVVCLKHKNHH